MKSLLILSSMIAAPLFAASGGALDSDDFVGVSFWLVTAAMAAATVFFLCRKKQCRRQMENFINSCRFNLRYSFLALPIHERCLD